VSTKRIVWVLLALLAIPFVVALIALHHPRWYPLLDMAQTELRVRDVASSHPPLIGLAGRIGPFGANGGSHPGPLSFYALWPVYALLGSSAFGMQAANVVLDIVAIGLALWMAFRRGGAALALAMGALLAILARSYGAFLLTLPWNPYLPVLWWFVFLLALWSVLDDDLPMLPVAIFAGTFCMQTHISYLGLVGGLVVVLIAALGYAAYRRRGDREARRSLWKWTVIALALGGVLWIPPVIDQIVHSPANLTVIRDHFSNPPDPPIGLHRGIDVLLTQLDPWKLVTQILVIDTRPRPVEGARLPGLLLLLAFGGSIGVAAWLRHRVLLMLDVVLGAALVLGLVSSARIFGLVWYYLLLWAWGLAALMLLAIGWTVVELFRGRTRLARPGLAILAAIMLTFVALFVVDAARVDVQSPRINETLGKLVQPTADALATREKDGAHGPYLVTWLPDAEAIGSQGFGLLNELDRDGFDVRAPIVFRPGATRYHVIDPAQATLQVHLATGPDITRWRNDSRFQEVARFDPRTDAEREEFSRLHDEVVAQLGAAGLNDLVPQVDDNLFMLGIAPNVPQQTRALMSRMLAIGMPAAVFIGPKGDPS
jgi:hypothetical protein